MKIKITTGFRADQYCVIDGDEAHKAYYLFLNPEKRGVFNNGVALVGKNIQGIEPAWNEEMGWSPSHVLTGDDWKEIRQSGKEGKMRTLVEDAKKVAYLVEGKPELMSMALGEAKTLSISEPNK